MIPSAGIPQQGVVETHALRLMHAVQLCASKIRVREVCVVGDHAKHVRAAKLRLVRGGGLGGVREELGGELGGVKEPSPGRSVRRSSRSLGACS